jgi:hypothetical protein
MRLFVTLSLILSFSFSNTIKAQAAEYDFCVQSDNYETFKAHVVFKSIDFGQSSARQMVLNDLDAALNGEFTVVKFNETNCPCEGDCAQVEVTSKDWDGNISDNGLEIGNIWGSAVEITDAVVSEGKALWDNPGQFLMTRILGQDKE